MDGMRTRRMRDPSLASLAVRPLGPLTGDQEAEYYDQHAEQQEHDAHRQHDDRHHHPDPERYQGESDDGGGEPAEHTAQELGDSLIRT